jgi:hypothetical protein
MSRVELVITGVIIGVAQCIQIPCPSAAVALAGKGKVTLTAGKGREEL